MFRRTKTYFEIFALAAVLALAAYLWQANVAVNPGCGVYVVAMAAASQAFWFDLRYTFSRLGTLSLADRLDTVSTNYILLLS